jgi:hypothetical protein
MNLIQKLESDVSQATEYGGLPNFYTRTELRQIIAALKIGQMLVDHVKVFDLNLNPTMEDLDNLDKIIQVWNDSINP